MLVLSRKEKQSFLLGDDIEITLLEISGDKAKIAINAPKEISILRKELWETKQANIESVASSFDPAKLPKFPVKPPIKEE
jgi:carbon storage regulator